MDTRFVENQDDVTFLAPDQGNKDLTQQRLLEE